MSETEQLIAEQIPKLRRYARALLGDPIRADDLVQEALVRGLSRSHLWQPGTDIRAWMFTILHNIHINNQRQRRARADYQELDDDQPEMATPPNQERSLEIRDLARALQLLPEPQRQVVLLVGLEGLNYKHVAAVLDIPIGTVMSRLHRGREALRRFMAHGAAPQAAGQDPKLRSMSMTTRQISIDEDDFQAFVDGQLLPEQRRAVMAYLAGSPDEAARMGHYRTLNEALHLAFDEVLYEALPKRLRVEHYRGRSSWAGWLGDWIGLGRLGPVARFAGVGAAARRRHRRRLGHERPLRCSRRSRRRR